MLLFNTHSSSIHSVQSTGWQGAQWSNGTYDSDQSGEMHWKQGSPGTAAARCVCVRPNQPLYVSSNQELLDKYVVRKVSGDCAVWKHPPKTALFSDRSCR